jgi:hypothetical protein
MSSPADPSRLKRAARRILRPLFGPLDGRVGDINRRVDAVGASLDAYARVVDSYARSTIEAASYTGVELRRIEAGIEELLSACGVGGVAIGDSRIVELPFAFGVLGRLSPPARVLVIDGAESTFALSAASLGYRVTVIGDAGGPARSHSSVEGAELASLASGGERFDAAFLIGGSSDRELLELVGGLLVAEGLLVLTTPDAQLSLPDGWALRERRVAARRDDLRWLAAEQFEPGETGVVMVVASPVPLG